MTLLREFLNLKSECKLIKKEKAVPRLPFVIGLWLSDGFGITCVPYVIRKADSFGLISFESTLSINYASLTGMH